MFALPFWVCPRPLPPTPSSLSGIEPPAVDGVVNENEVFAVKGGTPGDFGLYIFAMSWKAEW